MEPYTSSVQPNLADATRKWKKWAEEKKKRKKKRDKQTEINGKIWTKSREEMYHDGRTAIYWNKNVWSMENSWKIPTEKDQSRPITTNWSNKTRHHLPFWTAMTGVNSSLSVHRIPFLDSFSLFVWRQTVVWGIPAPNEHPPTVETSQTDFFFSKGPECAYLIG